METDFIIGPNFKLDWSVMPIPISSFNLDYRAIQIVKFGLF